MLGVIISGHPSIEEKRLRCENWISYKVLWQGNISNGEFVERIGETEESPRSVRRFY